MKNHITVEELKQMILYTAEQVIRNEPFLTKIDSAIGDGDHGKGMTLGFKEVLYELSRMQFVSAEEVFVAAGNILIDTMGGASGVLFGTMFISGTVRRQPSLTMDLQDFAEIFRYSLDAIKQRGGAKVGDKTMVDALEPAVIALEKCVEEKEGFCTGMKRAAQACAVGVEYTKRVKARFGRAKYFGEKAIGHQDAGATSVWIIFQSMADWIEEHFSQWEKYESKVVTITMNPCIDKTINVEKVERGQTHRLKLVQNDISGKGINVSIALTHFEELTVCLGFNYSADARIVEKALDEQGVRHDFVKVDGGIRTNVKIFEKEYGMMTEFNENGGCVGEEEQQVLLEKIENCLEQANIIVLDGSVPEGVSEDIYGRIIRMANRRGVKTVLDAVGKLLEKGADAVPYLMKPNVDEFCNTYHIDVNDGEGILKKAREIINRGVEYLCISFGQGGAYLLNHEKLLYAEPVDVEIKGVQGAGDSMVAGFCLAINRGLTMEEMFVYGVAAASGSLQYLGTRICEKEDLERLIPKVKIREVNRILPLGTLFGQ